MGIHVTEKEDAIDPEVKINHIYSNMDKSNEELAEEVGESVFFIECVKEVVTNPELQRRMPIHEESG